MSPLMLKLLSMASADNFCISVYLRCLCEGSRKVCFKHDKCNKDVEHGLCAGLEDNLVEFG